MRHPLIGSARRALPLLLVSAATFPAGAAVHAQEHVAPVPRLEEVVPNDNRSSAGAVHAGVLRISLEARLAAWRADLDVDTATTVQAFAEAGGPPRIPAPLVRAHAGTEIAVTVRNSLTSGTLVVHGLRAGTVPDDTLHIEPGALREIRFRGGAPGTYLYWATTTGEPIGARGGRDSQLTGAIVIDPAGTAPDPAERIFVMTVIDVLPTDTARNPAGEDIWDLAVNGRSWPHTERLEYPVGDTVRWRWVNGSLLSHPMHLHGFHFRVLAKGDGATDDTYSEDRVRDAVTEFMPTGSTFRMEWLPTRPGNWLMHCHMIPHITPFPLRPDSVAAHDVHDVERHPIEGMAGLVLGIRTIGPSMAPLGAPAARHLRLLAQEAPVGDGPAKRRGYVLQRGSDPRPDSVETVGSALVLERGETTAITVVNRLSEPTTVHWHGMELESVFDGVAGWSGAAGSIAPLISPGDSFTVAFTPPRAGTFIYHTHMDEGAQLVTGMYGAMLVMEPGQSHDPSTDLLFMLGRSDRGEGPSFALNGDPEPKPLDLRVGTTYRLRLINILPAAPVRVRLFGESGRVPWVATSKDGADLPPGLRDEAGARFTGLGVGETYDFEWTPTEPMDATMEFSNPQISVRQTLRVRQ